MRNGWRYAAYLFPFHLGKQKKEIHESSIFLFKFLNDEKMFPRVWYFNITVSAEILLAYVDTIPFIHLCGCL